MLIDVTDWISWDVVDLITLFPTAFSYTMIPIFFDVAAYPLFLKVLFGDYLAEALSPTILSKLRALWLLFSALILISLIISAEEILALTLRMDILDYLFSEIINSLLYTKFFNGMRDSKYLGIISN